MHSRRSELRSGREPVQSAIVRKHQAGLDLVLSAD
jgi:hypothetical protein